LMAIGEIFPFKATIGVLKGQELAMATLGGLMETFYKPILAQAKKDRIPILDLPNTLNPYGDFYIAQIEPNAEASQLIAEGLSHIIHHHDFTRGSLIYSKKENQAEYTAAENLNGWTVDYPTGHQ
jgi:hypothetical protein